MQLKAAVKSAFFITFNGNCKEALSFYQACFGGELQVHTFAEPMEGFAAVPVVIGSLTSEKLVIHASDLVQDEGRRVGNHLALYIQCDSHQERLNYLKKLTPDFHHRAFKSTTRQKLVEVSDRFDVVWVFAV